MAKLESLAAGAGCFVVSLYFSVMAALFAGLVLWTDRNLDFWLTVQKGAPVDVPLWLSALASIFAPFAVLGNIVGEIARLVYF